MRNEFNFGEIVMELIQFWLREATLNGKVTDSQGSFS